MYSLFASLCIVFVGIRISDTVRTQFNSETHLYIYFLLYRIHNSPQKEVLSI